MHTIQSDTSLRNTNVTEITSQERNQHNKHKILSKCFQEERLNPRAARSVAPSCLKVTRGNASIFCNVGSKLSRKSIIYCSTIAVQDLQTDAGKLSCKKEREESERVGETTPISHMRRMQWLYQVDTTV